MIRVAIAAAGLVISYSAVVAQSDPIAERKNLMKSVGAATSLGAKIAKGDEAFDAVKVQGIFKVYVDAAKKMPSLFPEKSKTGSDTTASQRIWDDQAAFLAAFGKFEAEAKFAMAVTDLAGFSAAFGDVTKNCSTCHETYRIKK